jgi:hypothetical protein
MGRMNGWKPKTGKWVEVRPLDQIMSTLDANAALERLPFMPEMARFAGRRFRISAVAHKTCDTINGTGGRSLRAAVHLEDLRCDGSAHGGCQAECLLFWKTAWLREVDGPSTSSDVNPVASDDPVALERLKGAATGEGPGGAVRYRCQATQLYEATTPLPWWDVRQYWRDVTTGNVSLSRAVSTLVLAAIYNLRRLPVGYRLNCALYDVAHRWIKGRPDPHPHGRIPMTQPTPDVRKNLAVGDLVEVLPKQVIEQTLNESNRNRGLRIDVEEFVYCGGRYRVTTRVEQIINEKTGEMMHFKNPCIVLDGVVCRADYSSGRLLCPRRINAYWREAWLHKVETHDGSVSGG